MFSDLFKGDFDTAKNLLKELCVLEIKAKNYDLLSAAIKKCEVNNIDEEGFIKKITIEFNTPIFFNDWNKIFEKASTEIERIKKEDFQEEGSKE